MLNLPESLRMVARPLVSLVTGGSIGFGALTARALARSGHIVYAGFLQADGDKNSVYKDAATFPKRTIANFEVCS